MKTFIPFGPGKVTNEDWCGVIEISPPLSFREASYLAHYLTTWHFEYPNKELGGLYGVHNDKERELTEAKEGSKSSLYVVNKRTQDHVPSLISPLILGSTSWDKKNVVNAIGMKTQIKGLPHAGSWVLFLIEHFFKKDAYAKHLFHDTFGQFQEHVCNGSILYRDKDRGGLCTEIQVINNQVKNRGVKKKYIGRINDGFKEIDYPIFLKSSMDKSAATELRRMGLEGAFPKDEELIRQDKEIKIKDVYKNLDYEKAIYLAKDPVITITEKLKVEYEEYFMENTIPESLVTTEKISKF